ncbi:MAG: YraN family protein [Flavobacteriaceae bacterium]|nr:YraN family protein [Eudoraea sp.]NNJ39221.1 YraN family protein [Flavobacteriaceae bacterium]
MANHQYLGKYGEDKAARFLESAGYQIVARNYRYLKAEIDLIAKKDEVLAIVEVKTRTGRSLVHMAEAVNKRKIDRLVMAADQFIVSRELDVEARFDIIWITKYGNSISLEHIENAFHHF